MPDYKKKHRSKLSKAPTPKKRNKRVLENTEDIKMSSGAKPQQPSNEMRVVKGRKLAQQRRSRIILGTVAFLAAVFLLFQLLLPAGIFETVGNLFALIGSGSYPIEFESNDSLNSISRGQYYYLLTDTEIKAFSNAGKEIYSYAHGFENPVLKTSATRALVFEQGGTDAFVFDLNSLKSTVKTKKNIITASISDSGTYALVTHSDNYASAVSVYSKKNKLLYEWYSSDGTVNNVAIAPSGKKIAVSLFTSNVGQYNSKLSVLTFDSATPEFSKTYEGTLIYTLDTFSKRGFSVLTLEGYQFIKWSNYQLKEYSDEYTASMFRASSRGSVVVFNRESDKTDNRIAVFSARGELEYQFKFNGLISDIQLSHGHIYCISDTKIYIFDEQGNVIRSAECGFGAVRIAVIGTNSVAVITDNKIEKIKLEQVK